jgi:hypothetical protein
VLTPASRHLRFLRGCSCRVVFCGAMRVCSRHHQGWICDRPGQKQALSTARKGELRSKRSLVCRSCLRRRTYAIRPVARDHRRYSSRPLLGFGIDNCAGVLLHDLRVFDLGQWRDLLALRNGLHTHEVVETKSREHEHAVNRLGPDIGHRNPGVGGDENRGAAMHLP